MQKTYVLDTNILLSDPNALFSFEEHNLLLPIVVLEELDRHKDRQDEVGRNARETSRKLSSLTKEHKSLNAPISLGDKRGFLRILSVNSLGFTDPSELIPVELSGKSGDNQILAVCLAFQKKLEEGQSMTLVTRDSLLRLKANVLGVPCEDYRKLHVATSANVLYRGMITLEGAYDLEKFYQTNELELPQEIEENLHPNQFLVVKETGTERSALVRYYGPGVGVKKIAEYSPSKIDGRNKEQKFAIDLLLDTKIPLVTVVGSAGTGKAQPLYSKVLTPTGWTTMGEVKPGTLVVGRNGMPVKVLSVHPQGKKEIFRVVFSDGTSTECCDEHLWNVKTEKDRATNKAWRTLSLKEIKLFMSRNKKRQLSVPMVEPVQFTERHVPLDPYLLGILLGDGGMSQHGVSLSTADEEVIQEVTNRLPESCKVIKKPGKNYDYSISRKVRNNKKNEVVVALTDLGLMGSMSYEKFIPELYKFNSTEIRLGVLRGLMDTDGTVSQDGTSTVFYTTSKQLGNDVSELVQSFGGKARLCKKQTSFTHKGEKRLGKPSYAVHISMPKDIIPFTITRKVSRFKPRTKYQPARYIDRIEAVGTAEAQCIYLDSTDHLYVTDDYLVTHNTLLAIAAGLHQVLNTKNYKSLVVCRPIQPVGKDIGFLPGTMDEKMEPWVAPIKDNLRYLLSADGKKSKRGEETMEMLFENGVIEVEAMTFIRGRSIANAYMIIDEAQNLNAHELKTIITRVGEGTKIVLTGDIEQIDNLYVDSVSNGLTVAIEKFKDSTLSGHITLTKGERSTLATLAAKIL